MRWLELRIPPLLVVAAAAVARWLAARHFPDGSLDLPGGPVLASAFALAGVFIAAAGVVEFRRARTTTNPMAPQSAAALVTRGVYRLSRNPMYLGFLLVLLGWAFFLSNPATLLVVVAFVFYLTRFQIAPEEKILQEKFGAAFERYRRESRRWL